MPIRPGAYLLKKLHLSAAVIGSRADRLAVSFIDGGGATPSIAIKIRVGIIKTRPAKKGIQFSVIPKPSSMVPTDLETPSETIKLAHNPAIKNSVFFLPSKKPSTRPNITPSERPFNNKQIIFHGRGT